MMIPPHIFVFMGNPSLKAENIFHHLCRTEDAKSLQSFSSIISDVNRYLLKQFDVYGQQCVHAAACSIDAQRKVELLIQWGADINSQDKYRGDTPLHIAAYTMNYGLARWICQQPGRKLEVSNFYHKTPLCVASDQKDLRMMWLLKSSGALCRITCSNDQD